MTGFCFSISDYDGLFSTDSIVTGFFPYFDCDGFFVFTDSIVTGFLFSLIRL